MARPSVLSPLAGATLPAGTTHSLPATPETCFWGFFDRSLPAVLEIASGDLVEIEAVTHHAGDAPDLLMDDGIDAIWDGIAESTREPGVHIMTGPIAVAGAEPGDALAVRIVDMTPRLPHGSNCAANWGLLYDTFGKERITIYELDGDASAGFTATASPRFGFDFDARPTYDLPGVITPPDPTRRQPWSVPVAVPVRPHFGVMGVAPPTEGRHNSIPPGVFGGNVDNWRIGPGATICYPVFAEGAGLFVGDPHFAQGDGEICGTAIEASLNATIQVWVVKGMSIGAPLLEYGTKWITHGFGHDLDTAMRMAAEQMLTLLVDRVGLRADEAYSLCSVAMDLGVTQVVDTVVGCHAAIDRTIFEPGAD